MKHAFVKAFVLAFMLGSAVACTDEKDDPSVSLRPGFYTGRQTFGEGQSVFTLSIVISSSDGNSFQGTVTPYSDTGLFVTPFFNTASTGSTFRFDVKTRIFDYPETLRFEGISKG